MNEMTKAQRLIEIADWVKKQNPEFMKNFKTMKAILKFYSILPSGYDKKKSIAEYIRQGVKNGDSTANKLALVIHTMFGFRYFKKAPVKYYFYLSLTTWKRRNGETEYEVRCSPYDNCNAYNDFEGQSLGTSSITIKTLGDAKRAAEKLLKSQIDSKGEDYRVEYSSKLLDAMKTVKSTGNDLEIGYNIYL